MRKIAVKNQLYGAIQEMMTDSTLFYRSDMNHDFSHWTDAGKEELMSFMLDFSRKMLKAQKDEDEARARDMVFQSLSNKEK